MEQGIPLEETTVKVKEGWAQKQKGLLQVYGNMGLSTHQRMSNPTTPSMEQKTPLESFKPT